MGMLNVTGITTALALVAVTAVAAGNDSMTKPKEAFPENRRWRLSPAAASGAWKRRSTSSPESSRSPSDTPGENVKNPTYEQVSAGGTGHAESVQIVFDPSKIGYGKLLDIYWRNTDPTVNDRQFCDKGTQYRPAIFYHGEEQRRIAEKSKEELEKTKPFKEPILTEITPAGEFYPAEEYHQHYYRKNPIRYKYYRYGCGRDRRLEELWGKEAGGH